MKLAMNVAETLAGDVRIKFGCADARMSKHFLDDSQVGAVFEQMRGEGMAQHVRRDVSRNAGVAGARFDSAPHRRRGELCATLCQK